MTLDYGSWEVRSQPSAVWRLGIACNTAGPHLKAQGTCVVTSAGSRIQRPEVLMLRSEMQEHQRKRLAWLPFWWAFMGVDLHPLRLACHLLWKQSQTYPTSALPVLQPRQPKVTHTVRIPLSFFIMLDKLSRRCPETEGTQNRNFDKAEFENILFCFNFSLLSKTL